MPAIRKEQLYSEDFFLGYCNQDELGGKKLTTPATSELLRAAEKDGLIVPLLVTKDTKSLDGKEEQVEIRYYSPFQIFLVVALIKNVVDESGNLRDPHDIEWQQQQGARYINWAGWSAFSADIYKKKRGEEPDQFGNHFTVADEFHRVLRLIHGLEPESRYELMWDKRRLFPRLPTFAYNLDPIREGRAPFVQQYDLDAKKLKRVIANVGYLATYIDPLERWFHYVRRHSQLRRDQLKGPAAISQDLYGFCDIAYEAMEIAFGEKLPPLLDLIHPDTMPYLMERAEYATGDDIKAIRAAFGNLQKWVRENGDLIEELRPMIEREKIDVALNQIDQQMRDYEKRYGDRRYVGSTRTIWPETRLKLKDLDADTQKWVESMVKERTENKVLSPKELASLTATEMTIAIEFRMGDLERAVSDIAYRMAEATWSLNHKLDREKEMAKYPALQELSKQKDHPDFARMHAEFWRTGLKEVERPIQEKIDRLDRARKELHGIGNQTRLVFCAVCRSKPVILHHSHNDAQVTSEAICDDCLKSGKQLTTLGAGEWKCDRCGTLIYKFAHGNVLSDTLRNTSAVTIRLEYGRMEITARCPNRDCRTEHTRAIDEGWLP